MSKNCAERIARCAVPSASLDFVARQEPPEYESANEGKGRGPPVLA
jgi:hypothetical protein